VGALKNYIKRKIRFIFKKTGDSGAVEKVG